MVEMPRIDPQAARERAKRAARFLAADPRVKLVFLFGSAADPDRKIPVRDVDLAILTEPKLDLWERLGLQGGAAKAAGGDIDLVPLNEAGVVLAHEVAETGICLHSDPPELETDFVCSAVMRYLDFKYTLTSSGGSPVSGSRNVYVVLRIDALEVRLGRLEEVISRLQRLGRLAPEIFREDPTEMWKIERGLQVGAELLLDIGNHILAAEYGVSASEYRYIFQGLADQKVITQTLANRLEGLGGFRNIVVHNYLELDPERVLMYLERAPKDFSEFAREIRDWLGERPA